jgi:hypothetical protein
LHRCAAPAFALVATLLLSASMARAAGAKRARARISHTPPAEQVLLTPIPVWVESQDETVTRVILRYKAFGSKSWTAIDMTKTEGGWSGEIPCRDVGTVIGVLRYYVTAYDEQGSTLAFEGSMKKPIKVKIRRSIKSPPLHLPGRPPPARCADTSDCPPDFPGCSTRDYNHCASDDDCDEGNRCSSEQKCETRDRPRKNWIVFGGSQDVIFLSSSNKCAPENQDSGQFSCLRQDDGLPYRGTPLPESPALNYGPATTRVFLGYDRFISTHFALGVRGGYVVRALAPPLENRAPSLPILAEGRIAYWFSVEASVRPVFYLAGGYAPIDFLFQGFVREDRSAVPLQSNPDSQTLNVWTTRGPWFAGAGLGVMFATSSATGFLLEVEGVGTFPAISTAVRPALSFAIGF